MRGMLGKAWLLSIAASTAMGQTPAKDGETVQALLIEVRQLRQDIEGMTLASQRVQIALYRLQMQDAAVGRAAQRLDEMRNKRLGVENGRDHLAAEIQKFEATLNSGTLKEPENKEVQQRLDQLKGELERSTQETQSWQAAEAEAYSQFRAEQAKLTETQDRIDKLDKALENMAPKPQ